MALGCALRTRKVTVPGPDRPGPLVEPHGGRPVGPPRNLIVVGDGVVGVHGELHQAVTAQRHGVVVLGGLDGHAAKSRQFFFHET